MPHYLSFSQKPKSNKEYDEDDKDFLRKKKVRVSVFRMHRRKSARRLPPSTFRFHPSPSTNQILTPHPCDWMQEEEAALKKAREAILKGKKK